MSGSTTASVVVAQPTLHLHLRATTYSFNSIALGPFHKVVVPSVPKVPGQVTIPPSTLSCPPPPQAIPLLLPASSASLSSSLPHTQQASGTPADLWLFLMYLQLPSSSQAVHNPLLPLPRCLQPP